MSLAEDDFLTLPPAVPGEPPRRRRGRPTREEVAAREAAERFKDEAVQAALEARARDGDPDLERLAPGALPDIATFMRGCRITFLAQLFGTEPRRIGKKLANCPVMRWESHKGVEVPVYDFRTAIAYLIEPKIDMETWIRSQTSLSLPPAINKAFWEAMRTKMRVMAEAGHYWHDEDVLEVFGKVAMLIKDTTLLWIEDLPDKANLTSENYHAMRRMVDELLKQIQAELQVLPKTRRTSALVATLEAETQDAQRDFEDEE